MRALVRLLVVLALLNAVVHAGLVAFTYFQFRDASQNIVLFGHRASPEELHGQILDRAKDLSVPIVAADLTVERTGVRTVAVATYTEQVELFPRFTYPVPLSFSVDALSYEGGFAIKTPKSKPAVR